MKNKIAVILLIIVLAGTALLAVGCDKAPTAEYCTVSVRCTYGVNHIWQTYKIVKGEVFTLAHLVNTQRYNTSCGIDRDFCALSYTSDGLRLYDESQPVESDLTLYAICTAYSPGNTTRITFVAQSDRLKALLNSAHSNVQENYAYTAFFFKDAGVNNGIVSTMLGIEETDFQFKFKDGEEIYTDINQWYSSIFSYDEPEYAFSPNARNYWCTPFKHIYIPDVIIFVY